MMRVISQDGMIDVPYEMTAFHICNGYIHMNMAGDTGRGTAMACYSTREKALYAMKILRKNFDTLMEERTRSEILPSVFSYFQFPADDEVWP